jgi:hypothetical protein
MNSTVSNNVRYIYLTCHEIWVTGKDVSYQTSLVTGTVLIHTNVRGGISNILAAGCVGASGTVRSRMEKFVKIYYIL